MPPLAITGYVWDIGVHVQILAQENQKLNQEIIWQLIILKAGMGSVIYACRGA
jgi:hypothetical protein